MSFKRSSKPPARPPPPRGALSLGGMSFKKLEDEEEEEDLTISDKYTTLIQQNRSIGASSLSSSAKGGSPPILTEAKTDPLTCDGEDGERASPQRKGKLVFEYKEIPGILSGLKGRIQEKITKSKTIEDMSGESSASASPDKEHPLSLAVDDRNGPPTTHTDSCEESSTKATTARMSSFTHEPAVRPTSVTDPVRRNSEERLSPTPLTSEKSFAPQPVQLSALMSDDKDGEESIMVFEEHFKEEPVEDFTGGLTTSTMVRSRSKLKTLAKKKAAKTVATVSMSGLMKAPEVENVSQKLSSDKKEGENSGKKLDDSTPDKSATFMRLVSQEGQVLPWPKFLALIICLFAYFILPLPSYVSGLITGCLFTTILWSVYLWLTQPAVVKEPPKLIPIEDLPPMEIPEMKETSLEDGVYKVRVCDLVELNSYVVLMASAWQGIFDC